MADFAAAAAQNLRGDRSSLWQFKSAFSVLTPNQFPVNLLPGVTGRSGANFVLLNATQAPSGFKSQYQDQILNADQGHHFAAFFQMGFVNGADIGKWGAKAWEQLEGSSSNAGDVNLGKIAAQMGADVAAGILDPSDVASAISNKLCN